MYIYISNPTIACLLAVFSVLSGLVVLECSVCNKTKLLLFSGWYVYPVVHHKYLGSELIKIWYLKDTFLLGGIVFSLHTVVIRKGMWLDI